MIRINLNGCVLLGDKDGITVYGTPQGEVFAIHGLISPKLIKTTAHSRRIPEGNKSYTIHTFIDFKDGVAVYGSPKGELVIIRGINRPPATYNMLPLARIMPKGDTQATIETVNHHQFHQNLPVLLSTYKMRRYDITANFILFLAYSDITQEWMRFNA